jgi:transketolase N-terminal domain/subunit
MDDITPRKMSPTEIREFDLKERWRAVGLTPIELSYNDMRRLTIALHNEGSSHEARAPELCSWLDRQ